jgi:predicted RNA binding protein YcfA (HicA-like mRNA interferase family)
MQFLRKLLERFCMLKVINTKKLAGVLEKLGFEKRSNGSHAIFHERVSGVTITLPMNKKELPIVYSRPVVGQILRTGLVSERELDNLLK